MLFWIAAALMTFGATLALLMPLLGRRAAVRTAPEAHDLEVYRDQLREIDRDVDRAQIDAEQAAVARAEIGRRLLGAARKQEGGEAVKRGGSKAARRTASRLAMAAILVLMPVVAVISYLALGAPGARQQPLAARLEQDPAKADINVLIANAERHLAADPDDGRGWDVLAPIYLRTGRIAEAEHAFRKAISLLGPSADRQSGLGEALVSQADGVVTEEARLVFQSARELNPEDPRPAFFLAIAKAQEGKLAEARKQFQALINRAPPGAPWLAAVRQQMAALDDMPALPDGASSRQMAEALAGMPPEERDSAIRSMVGTLEARLQADPRDLEGWLMLVRSKSVLGDAAGAQIALNRALVTFPSGEQASRLAQLARELGLQARPDLGGVPVTASRPKGGDRIALPEIATAPFMMPRPGAEAPADDAELRDPSDEEIAAAAQMSPEDRQDMIREMVASLDRKLRENPANPAGWLRLIRSYAVLGDSEAAWQAVERARDALSGDKDGLARIDQLLADLSLNE